MIDLLNFKSHVSELSGLPRSPRKLGATQISEGLALSGMHHANMYLGSLGLFRGPPARARFLHLPGGRVGEEIALSRLPWVSTRRLPLDVHPNAFAKGNWPYPGSFHPIFGFLLKGVKSKELRLHPIAAYGHFAPLAIDSGRNFGGICACLVLSHLHFSSQEI